MKKRHGIRRALACLALEVSLCDAERRHKRLMFRFQNINELLYAHDLNPI